MPPCHHHGPSRRPRAQAARSPNVGGTVSACPGRARDAQAVRPGRGPACRRLASAAPRRPGGRTVSTSFNFVIASRRVSFRVASESFSRLLGPLCDCPRHSPVPTAAHSDRPLVAPNLKVRNRLCSGLRPGALWYLRQATWRYPSLAGRRLPRDCHS